MTHLLIYLEFEEPILFPSHKTNQSLRIFDFKNLPSIHRILGPILPPHTYGQTKSNANYIKKRNEKNEIKNKKMICK